MRELSKTDMMYIQGARSHPKTQVPVFFACAAVGAGVGTVICPMIGTIVGGVGLPILYGILEANV